MAVSVIMNRWIVLILPARRNSTELYYDCKIKTIQRKTKKKMELQKYQFN